MLVNSLIFAELALELIILARVHARIRLEKIQ